MMDESCESYNNYCLKEGGACTEDDYASRNLLVHEIPHMVTEKELFDYFSTFGEVEKVCFIAGMNQSGQSAPEVASVLFVDHRAAAAVLQKSEHYLKAKRMLVKTTADSGGSHALEVQANANYNNGNSVNGVDKGKSETLMPLQLNEYCLELVCKQLQFREQVNFARSCELFASVFQLCSKSLYQTFNLGKLKYFTPVEIKDFFKLTGPHIKILFGLVCKQRECIIESINHYCQQVESIRLYSIILNTTSVHKLLGGLKFVSKLGLSFCSIEDNAILTIKELPNLEYLDLSENVKLSGKHMDKLTNLKELILYGCVYLHSPYMVNMLKSLKKLRRLDIRQCLHLSPAVFRTISIHCSALELLEISSRGYVEDMDEWPARINLSVTENDHHYNYYRSDYFDESASDIEYDDERFESVYW